MNVDKRIVEPFNAWWREIGNHCAPSVVAIKAFDAGYKAALAEVRKASQSTSEAVKP
jgi:hypothetical protein